MIKFKSTLAAICVLCLSGCLTEKELSSYDGKMITATTVITKVGNYPFEKLAISIQDQTVFLLPTATVSLNQIDTQFGQKVKLKGSLKVNTLQIANSQKGVTQFHLKVEKLTPI